MKHQPYILARTMKAAHDFARGPLGLEHGQYRVLNSPSTIKSVRGAELWLVPGYQNRFDRFAMKGALKWTRMIVRDVAAEREAAHEEALEMNEFMAAPRRIMLGVPPSDAPDGLEPLGVQTSFFDNVAHEPWDANIPPEILAEERAVVEKSEAEHAEKPKARRRTRCKQCGTLHFKDEACVEVAE